MTLTRRAALVLTLLAACKGGESLPEAATLEAVAAANAQVGIAGGPLPAPLAVRVLSKNNEAVTRAAVRWAVTTGSGATLSDTLTLSDGNGIAEVGFTLGAAPGNYGVTATLVDLPDQAVLLAATAQPAPVLASIAPTTFAGGDTVTITGQDLAAVDRLRIGGTIALVVSTNATQIRAVAPICRPDGPVQVVAYRLGAASNPLQATFTGGGTVTLAVGEWSVIDPTRLPGCVTFPGAGATGAEYVATVQSVTGTPGVTAAYVFGGDSVVPAPPSPPPTAAPTAAQQFHDRLRAWEGEVAAVPHAALAPPALAPTIRRPKVGDERDFRVCSTITCSDAEDFAPVRGKAVYVGTHAAIYLDKTAPTGGFSQTDFDSLGVLFDEQLYDVGTTYFGAESDIDENGVVIVLLTPVVNGLTDDSQCQNSIITGFFFGIDIDEGFRNDQRSNRGEVFYALAPDPEGSAGCSLGLDVVKRLVPVTFVHEFQHMISYHQHVLLRGGSQEVLWLNEGLSHLSEELAALRFDALGRADLFSRFALGNLFNAYRYLKEPGSHFLIPLGGTGSLEERGSAWLFLRWLVDQYGDGIVRRLVETNRTGAANIEAVAGESLDRLLPDWFLATWVSDLANFTAPPRLRYTTWRFRTTYQSLHDQSPGNFDRPFPIVPTLFAGGQFGVTGTLRSGSGSYYRVVQGTDQAGFALRLTGPGGAALPASALPRVTVIRIR